MKWIVLSLILALAIAGPGCEEATSETAPELDAHRTVCKGHNDLAYRIMTGQPRHTIVFFDQSSSTSEEAARAEYKKILEDRVKEDLLNARSTLEFFPIHSRTTGRAGALYFVQNVELPRQTNFVLETKHGCNNYANVVLSTLRSAWASIQERLQHPIVNDHNTSATDVWGILEVASTQFSDSAPGVIRSVYVLSDMLECMPNKAGQERRCFERMPPSSKLQAEAWAKADAQRLPMLLNINQDALKDVTFHFIMGRHALNDASRNVPYYWQALLVHLGVPDSQIHFQ